MDAFFLDPDVERLPPESTRITDLRAVPLADNRRVHIWLELTPFQERPEIELTLTAPELLQTFNLIPRTANFEVLSDTRWIK